MAMRKVKKILITDDDPSIEDVLQSMIEYGGYGTLLVRDPDAIVPVCEAETPDLVVLDVWVEHSDGRDICRLLKQGELTKRIPIIMISASRGIGSSALAAGADDFLEKPFDMVELLETISKHLRPMEDDVPI